MALVNHQKAEINAKIVYFGPGLAGKSTNLKHVYSRLKPEFRGQLKSMNIQGSKMIFFDFTPPGEGQIRGYQVRFHLYTVAGDVPEASPWQMVLKGVDGIVFVADSAPDRLEANRNSLLELGEIMLSYGVDLADIPVVMQFNKRDLPDALTREELQQLLEVVNYPGFEAVSAKGEGVLGTLLPLVKMVYGELRGSGLDLNSALDQLQGASVAVGQGDETLDDEPEPLDNEYFPEEPPALPAAPAHTLPDSIPVATGLKGALLVGEPVDLGEGKIRIPLKLDMGGGARSVSLSVTFAVETT